MDRRAAPQSLATATVPCTALSCQSCKCTNRRAAPQSLATATVPYTALSCQSCRCFIFALHCKVWPPPRCIAPRSRASLASARIFALLHKVWPPPRCRAPRCRTSFAGASSSRCTARFGHRHGALHRAVVPVLQVQASSCCIARFFASTAPRTAQSWTSCNASIFALRHKISTSTVPCTAQSCQS